jgi:hypothetical protein
MSLKIKVYGLLVVWPQNHWDGFSRFGIKTGGGGLSDLGLKINVTVSWFGPQNHVGYGLSVAVQNRPDDEDSTGHALRSSDLLHVEASRVRVSQSDLKSDRDVMTGDARDTIMEVA